MRWKRDSPEALSFLWLGRQLEPQWSAPPHVRHLAKTVREAILSGDARLVVNLPPRHGKSLLLCRLLPAWYALHRPRAQIVIATHTVSLAKEHGIAVREYLRFCEAQLGEPLLDRTLQSTERIRTVAGGYIYCVGVGGALIGRGADLAIVDDPYPNLAAAYSKKERENVQRWFEGTLYTRLQGARNCIVVQQRWHRRDLAGVLLSKGWRGIVLPAEAREGDPLGRAVGEPLWKEKFPLEALHDIRRQIGETLYQAIYQQSPEADEGNLFRAHHLQWRYDAPPPPDALRLISVDTATSEREHADYTAILVWAYDGQSVYLLDLMRLRVEYPALVGSLSRLAEQYRPHYVLIEDSNNGRALAQSLRREPKDYTLLAVPPVGSKYLRAMTCVKWFENAQVLLPPHHALLTDYISELMDFPTGTHDDYVDATSLMLNWLDTHGGAVQVRTVR